MMTSADRTASASRTEHWDQVYQTKGSSDVSWYQWRPDLSLSLIAATGVPKDGGILDVGGGASTLVDHLLEEGYTNLAVLDLSAAALDLTCKRLGERAASVQWFAEDVTMFQPNTRWSLWHDRAVFHFLTGAEDRRNTSARFILRSHRTGTW